ncbi:MAG TPA: VOC family protein [Alphaproteobacteria bacterium]
MTQAATTDRPTIAIQQVDHIGIRVRDLERALAFYDALGFKLHVKVPYDDVAIIRNDANVEINLIINANAGDPARNILMDVPEKYAGYTHVALRVSSIAKTMAALKAHGIAITQGPVSFGADGHVSVFVRDADRNVIELRGRAEDASTLEGVKRYTPE